LLSQRTCANIPVGNQKGEAIEVETRDWQQTTAIIARFFKVKAEDLP
jgi:hypothetical protein